MLTGGRKWVKVSKGEKDQDLYRLSTSGSGDNSATVSVASGHIARAGFVHGGSEKASLYRYLTGSNLLITLTMPNNMTLTQSYEAQRDLLTGQVYKRGGTGVAERLYTYNALGIPTTRRTARQGMVRHDAFGYNERSELTSVALGSAPYAYAYDNDADGCKGDWTNREARLPRRGEPPTGSSSRLSNGLANEPIQSRDSLLVMTSLEPCRPQVNFKSHGEKGRGRSV